jgi:hypothetical protein
MGAESRKGSGAERGQEPKAGIGFVPLPVRVGGGGLAAAGSGGRGRCARAGARNPATRGAARVARWRRPLNRRCAASPPRSEIGPVRRRSDRIRPPQGNSRRHEFRPRLSRSAPAITITCHCTSARASETRRGGPRPIRGSRSSACRRPRGRPRRGGNGGVDRRWAASARP